MNGIRFWLPAALVLAVGQTGLADGREAAQRALGATVAVEFEARESQTGDLPAAQPDAAAEQSRSEALHEAYGKLAARVAAAGGDAPAQPPSRVWDRAVRAYLDHARTPQRAPDLTLTSGTIVAPAGLIVTFGLPSGEGRLNVTLSDGARHEARLVGKDLRTGLHLLKVDAADLPAASLAEQRAEIGQGVIAGYCLSEQDRAVGRGIVAATKRTLPGFSVGLLQTDAAVGRMSAGGPLIDETGSLVGILAAVQTRDGEPRGATLAISAEHVRPLLEAGREGGVAVIQRPRLGVQPVDRDGRVIIGEVYVGTAAETAGLREGDEIVAIDRERVRSLQDVVRIVAARRPGDRIDVTIRRDGRDRTLTATLGQVPADSASAPAPATPALSITATTPGHVLLYPRTDGTVGSLLLTPSAELHAPLFAPSLRVERSDVEKKLDELSRDLRDLTKQMEALSRQLERIADRPERAD